ncbi:LysR family transcriptional regulator [Mesorhizobium sp. LSHC412B00]|nr:LysR family transcriptional regulator [Mesorhizobium sp. LSHC412B00]
MHQKHHSDFPMAPKSPETSPHAHRLPPLVMVRAFEAAGRTGSMRRAAEDIGVSHTVISRHVRNLEHWLGRTLVRAGPRGVELTAEGESFLATVSRALGAIAHAAHELRPSHKRGQLRIWCIAGLATRWLTPRLSALERALEGADIELRATDSKPDFARAEADVSIGFNVLERLPQGAMHLIRPRMFPVAGRDWLDRHGIPADLTELARSPLLHEGNHMQWTNWFEAVGEPLSHRLLGPRLSDASISYDAALAGQGIALVNALMAADELASGRLVELFDTNVELGTYYLLTAPNRSGDPLVGVFKDWIADNIRRSTTGDPAH